VIIHGGLTKDIIIKGMKTYRCKAGDLRTHMELARARRKDACQGEEREDCKDGCIEIVSGKAVVSDPVGGGRYAAIDPADTNVEVYLNGRKINSVSIVTRRDIIEFKPAVKEAVTEVKAELTEDKMKAVLTVTKTPGQQYYVEDAPKTGLMKVLSGCKETPAPDATMERCIRELERIKVAPKFIDKNAIKELLEQPDGGSAVVAEGIYPIDGRAGRVKYLFESENIRNPAFETDERVDLLGHTILPTVEVGQVLAIKENHAIPGRDGETVTGEPVKAKPPVETPFKAGKGTVLLDRDTKIVAACSGRPMLKNGTVSVVPLLVIPGDVCPETGNIYFNGDVHIKGSVMDNMKVVADGNITVSGSVLQAALFAGGSVDIHGNIISSSIMAGAGMVDNLCVIPKIKEILKIVEKDFCGANSKAGLNGYKETTGRGADLYSARIKSVDKIAEDIKALARFLADDDYAVIKDILERVHIIYAAGSSASTAQVNRLKDRIQEYLAKRPRVEDKGAVVRLKYAQNSIVQATDEVLVLGRGTYQTYIIAKNAIKYINPSSVALGGTLVAGKRISMGIVGSSRGITTHCRVLEKNGKIYAVRLYSNTVITINGRKKIV